MVVIEMSRIIIAFVNIQNYLNFLNILFAITTSVVVDDYDVE